MGDATSEGRKGALRGRLVEGVRLIFVALLGTAGYEISARVSAPSGSQTLLYVFLGAGVGYVIGGVLGRLTLRAVTGLERELRRTPAPQVAGAVVGLIVGLIIGALLMVPLLFLPAAAAWPALVFLYMVLGSLGFRIGAAKYEDIFGLVGMKPRAAVASRGDLHVIDTSALIDGRVADLVATGFVAGTMLLHDGVLRICGLSERNHDILRTCRLDGLMPHYHDSNEAVLGTTPRGKTARAVGARRAPNPKS